MTDPSEISAGIRPGDVLVGKYRVERVLGTGGMGVVVSAHHLQLDERVALKLLLPEARSNPEVVARFAREAQAAVKIKSEHVARVSDVGVLDSGAPYMVMEYLEGRDLSVWLAREGPLPIELAVDFVLQACEALAEAHSLGIVHRDLKPANLFCIQRSDGQMAIKVLDFGISKLTTARASRHDLTRTRTLMGTPLYMSPEQMQSAKKVDERSDIWALGVILHELVSGGPPFDAEAVTDLAIKVATMPAPSLREARGDVPEALARVVAKCLEKAPQERFQTIGELALALQEFAPAHARLSVDRAVATLRRAGEGGGASSPSIEIVSTGVRGAPQLPLSTARGAETEMSSDRRGTGGRSGTSRRALGGIAVGLAVVGLGLWLVAQNTTTRVSVSAEVPRTTPSAAASSRAIVPEPSPAVSPAPPATGVAAVVDLAPTAAPSVAPQTSSARAHPVRSASHGAPPPDCDPPYDVAPNGTHVFKKDCF